MKKVYYQKYCGHKMVLTTASSPPSTLQGMFGSPPKRGATLPKYLSGSNAAIDSAAGGGARRTARANTLPGHVATMNINNRDGGNESSCEFSQQFCTFLIAFLFH